MADQPGYQGRWTVVPWDKIAQHVQLPIPEYVVDRVTNTAADLLAELKPHRYGPLFNPTLSRSQKGRETMNNLDPEPWLVYINHRATTYRSPGWYESQPSDPIDINTVFSPRSVYSQKRDDYS